MPKVMSVLARAVRPAVLIVALATAAVGVQAEIIEQVLVKVNGEIFTKTDLEARQVARLREQGQRIDLKSAAGNEQLKRLLDQITPAIMADAIDEMLVVQRGKELGYRLTDEQFKSIVDNIRKENKLESDEQFQAALKQEGLSLNDLRKNVERNMIFSRVQQNEVMARVALTDEEARAYYDSHLQEFTTPPSVTLREILVAANIDPTKGVNVAAEEASKSKAEDIRKRALAGEDFEKLAAELSDAPSKANGGVVGPFNLTDLSSDLQKIIAPMKIGEITPVLRTTRGFQLLKLEAQTPNNVMPFEQAKERISDRVFTDKRRAEFDKYLDKLRSEAIIDWKNAEVQKAFEEGLKQRKAQQQQQSQQPAAPAPAPAPGPAPRTPSH